MPEASAPCAEKMTVGWLSAEQVEAPESRRRGRLRNGNGVIKGHSPEKRGVVRKIFLKNLGANRPSVEQCRKLDSLRTNLKPVLSSLNDVVVPPCCCR